MNVRDAVDQMSEILLAGSETTSGTIASFFLEIMRNTSVKEKLLKSLLILRLDDLIISSKVVRNGTEYEYLEACVKETLRMHPIASEMGRRTGAEPIELMGYLITPHTGVPPPEYVAEFLKMKAHAEYLSLQAYYPFSADKNSCVGVNFAWAEIRMVTANLLTRYDFCELPRQNIDWRQYITMQFEGGSWKASLMPRYEV
ncbi:cytochrome P450 3A9 [Botrytis cinerea]